MLDDLTAEHKRKYDQVMADLGKEVLKQYTWTRNGGIRYISDPESPLSRIDLTVPSEERSQALRQEVNYMIHHAIIRQTEVILNSLDNVVARVVKSMLAGEHDQDIGLVINSHAGEKKFYTRPLQVPQVNAPEGTKAEFIPYALQDRNDRPSCYEEATAFIPEGYICQLRYRPPAREAGANNHTAIGKDKPANQELLAWQS
ncbi:hypothetical protein PVAP13_3NG283882 [Panicum virgatum]|uniref:Uncharacterized protein n=1 Tax=Panicum virgatum TaxID=38727 RepID=A0A8T0UDN7_PANVG|nr:hypothetical protein PVAP13_3NG283882 [Panicum virgatum]